MLKVALRNGVAFTAILLLISYFKNGLFNYQWIPIWFVFFAATGALRAAESRHERHVQERMLAASARCEQQQHPIAVLAAHRAHSLYRSLSETVGCALAGSQDGGADPGCPLCGVLISIRSL